MPRSTDRACLLKDLENLIRMMMLFDDDKMEDLKIWWNFAVLSLKEDIFNAVGVIDRTSINFIRDLELMENAFLQEKGKVFV